MMEAVQPFVDASISETVNIPADYPYEDFKSLYREAWQAGLKGLATSAPTRSSVRAAQRCAGGRGRAGPRDRAGTR